MSDTPAIPVNLDGGGFAIIREAGASTAPIPLSGINLEQVALNQDQQYVAWERRNGVRRDAWDILAERREAFQNRFGITPEAMKSRGMAKAEAGFQYRADSGAPGESLEFVKVEPGTEIGIDPWFTDMTAVARREIAAKEESQ